MRRPTLRDRYRRVVALFWALDDTIRDLCHYAGSLWHTHKSLRLVGLRARRELETTTSGRHQVRASVDEALVERIRAAKAAP